MSKEFVEIIFNVETGETIERPYTKAEIAKAMKEREENALLEAELNAQIQKKNAIFEKLGITEEEAKLLLS